MIWLPLRSVPLPGPEPELVGPFKIVPSLLVTTVLKAVELLDPVMVRVRPEPSVAVDTNPLELGPPYWEQEPVLMVTAPEKECPAPQAS